MLLGDLWTTFVQDTLGRLIPKGINRNRYYLQCFGEFLLWTRAAVVRYITDTLFASTRVTPLRAWARNDFACMGTTLAMLEALGLPQTWQML